MIRKLAWVKRGTDFQLGQTILFPRKTKWIVNDGKKNVIKKKKERKKQGSFGEMPGSTAGEGKVQDELKTSYFARKEGITPRMIGACQMGTVSTWNVLTGQRWKKWEHEKKKKMRASHCNPLNKSAYNQHILIHVKIR